MNRGTDRQGEAKGVKPTICSYQGVQFRYIEHALYWSAMSMGLLLQLTYAVLAGCFGYNVVQTVMVSKRV